MRRITRVKRQEVINHYLLGNSYREIEEETGVSHGSIVNIVKEFEKGEMTTDGSSSEQVDDLRRLAAELKSSGLKPAQALNDIRFYKRMTELEITTGDLECWSNLIGELRHPDFPARHFLEAAQRLYTLEKSQGRNFEEIVKEYEKYQGETEQIREEISSLEQSKVALSDLTVQLSIESDELKSKRKSSLTKLRCRPVNYRR